MKYIIAVIPVPDEQTRKNVLKGMVVKPDLLVEGEVNDWTIRRYRAGPLMQNIDFMTALETLATTVNVDLREPK